MTVSADNPCDFTRQPLANRIDMVRDSFEQAWRAGKQPQIEEYLNEAAESEKSAFLRELMAVELAYRRKLGQEPVLQEFLDRFPSEAQIISAVFDDAFPSTAIIQDLTCSRTIIDPSGRKPYRSLFGMFSEPAADALESQMHEETFSAGEYIFRQGDPGTSLVLVRDGIVEISTEDETGKRHVIDQAGQGAVLGEMALLADEPRSANVAATTAVSVQVLPVNRFHELARQFPEISVVLTQLMSKRLGMPTRDVMVGKTLDRYRMQRRLGRGGMGVVYEAIDSASGERVAVKMMSHRLVYDVNALSQFQREADIIESFEHKNIVQMHRRFQAFHTYFIVTEFCNGETLRNMINRTGPMSENEFRELFGQVASAVAYAHARNVIHRDIKPSNIMVNQNGIVKLMDFGLAKPLADTHPTLPGQVVGTPRYMAPEQWIGNDVGKEADYFSLGCVAYEMLTARPLFEISNTSELLKHLRNWRVPEFGRECPHISDETCRMLQSCLGKEPQERVLDLEKLSLWTGHH